MSYIVKVKKEDKKALSLSSEMSQKSFVEVISEMSQKSFLGFQCGMAYLPVGNCFMYNNT